MKKTLLLFLILLTFSTTVFASDSDNLTNSIEPRASYVFSNVGSAISKSAYGGDCTLVAVGSGTLTIYLQKKLTSNNSWMPVDGASGSETFSNTRVCAYSKNKSLSSGTYRCKTVVTAKVGSYSDDKTVYSPELKIN